MNDRIDAEMAMVLVYQRNELSMFNNGVAKLVKVKLHRRARALW
jgi:hypothetical protein